MSMTQEEQQAFDIVIDILKSVINPERLSISESKSYVGVILDNNSHRTICRIYISPKGMHIGTISERKVETKVPINNLVEIRNFTNDLLHTVKCHDR